MRQIGFMIERFVTFSPEDACTRIEYCKKGRRESIYHSRCSIQWRSLTGCSKKYPRLLVPETVEKISKIDDHMAIASCGILADSRNLVDYARVRSQINKITFDEANRDLCLG